jgi:hypothetical protein
MTLQFNAYSKDNVVCFSNIFLKQKIIQGQKQIQQSLTNKTFGPQKTTFHVK